MAATVRINEYNTAGGTETTGITLGDWVATDAANTAAASSPLSKPTNPNTTYSYEKWHKLELVDKGSSTSLTDFRVYYSGSLPSGSYLKTNANSGPTNQTAFVTPVATVSSLATITFPTSDPGAARITGTLTTNGQKTTYHVSQLSIDSTITSGGTVTVYWAWTEVA